MLALQLKSTGRKFLSVFFVLVISSLFISVVPVHAASEAGLLFLLISPSPQANGMGQTYGTLAEDEPMAGIFNPASVGLFARRHFIGVSFYPQKVQWLPQLLDLTLNSHAVNLGLNLNKIKSVPVSVGMALDRVYLDYGKLAFENLKSSTTRTAIGIYERANIVSIGASVDYGLLFSVGFSYKWIESQLGYNTHGTSIVKANVNAYDWGIIVRAPLIEIFKRIRHKETKRLCGMVPYLTPGFYYAMTNIGDQVSYQEGMAADPLPRNLSMGFHFLAGLKYKSKAGAFNLYSFKWAREADDMLVSRSKDGRWQYLSPTNDIDFANNILLGKYNDRIIAKTGWEYNIGDFVFIRRGEYRDISGRVVFNTRGWGASLLQPVRILNAFRVINSNKIIIKILTHLDVIYSETMPHGPNHHFFKKSEFKGIIARLENFPL